MTLAELKNQIVSKSVLSDELIIFVCSENTYIADQYTRAICDLKGLEYTSSESFFSQLSALSLVLPNENMLHVIKVDEFSEVADDYSDFINTIVICNKIDKNLESLVSGYVIQIPKVEDWQLKAYITTRVPSLHQSEVDWLYEAAGKNIYRLENELDKVAIFDAQSQYSVFRLLADNPASDLYNFNVFNLAAAIIKKDMSTVAQIMLHRHFFKVELYSLLNTMLGQVKDTLFATRNSGRNPEKDLGLKSTRVWHLSKDFGQVSTDRLQYLLKELSAIDLKVKSGLLDLETDAQIDYILAKLLR